jgi:hypothetical protein
MLAPPALVAQRAASNAIQSEAWQLVELANRDREAQGAGPLRWDPALATAARRHCLRMAAAGSISHQYPGEADVAERTALEGAHFSRIEENVAFGPNPATIHSQWMHSPGHRSNLLNPEVDRVGVAVVAGPHGYYAVADYARAVAVLTPSQVEESVARLLRGQGLAILPDPTVAREYCVQSKGEGSRGQPRFLMLWQDAELDQLPRALLERTATGGYSQAAVGSCPAQQQASFSAYRIAVLLY